MPGSLLLAHHRHGRRLLLLDRGHAAAAGGGDGRQPPIAAAPRRRHRARRDGPRAHAGGDTVSNIRVGKTGCKKKGGSHITHKSHPSIHSQAHPCKRAPTHLCTCFLRSSLSHSSRRARYSSIAARASSPCCGCFILKGRGLRRVRVDDPTLSRFGPHSYPAQTDRPRSRPTTPFTQTPPNHKNRPTDRIVPPLLDLHPQHLLRQLLQPSGPQPPAVPPVRAHVGAVTRRVADVRDGVLKEEGLFGVFLGGGGWRWM